MKEKLKVGFVGVNRSSGFIRTFNVISETEVSALCDINEENLNSVADQLGVKNRFTRYEDMIDTDINIMVVGTPMPYHAPQAVSALRRGIHVITEVPACTDLTQCWDLVSAVREGKAKYMMAENYTYMKPNVLIRAMARQGVFGEVYFGEGEYIHELKELNEVTKWRRKWQTGINGCTYPTHSIGPLLQWFEDKVTSVACFGSGHHYRDPRGNHYENEDSITMVCKLAKGGLVNIRVDMLSNRPHNMTYYSLQGTKGCYESPRGFGDEPKIWLSDFHKEVKWHSLWDFEKEFMPEIWKNPPEEALRAGHGGGDYFEMRGFVDCILNDAKPPIDVYESLDMTVPGLVSQESIARGGIVLPVPDFRKINKFPDDLPEELKNSAIITVE